MSDGPPKGKARLEAERLAKEFPTTANRTLARRLANEYSITIEQARNLVRTAKGAIGKAKRPQRVVNTPHGKAGTKPKMPPSKAENWTPHVIEKAKRVAILSDIHTPYHCEIALAAAVAHLKSMKPDVLLLNGDTFDFYTISRWVKNPKKRDMKSELRTGRELMDWLNGEFACPIVFKKGNHEERWDHWLWNHAPEISDEPEMKLEHWMKFETYGATMVEDQRPIMVGKLPVFHGHELGRSIFSPVNPARGAFLRTHHTVLVAHSHQTSGHADTNLWHDETFVWSTGCLCDLSPEYARVNRWNHGCAFVNVGTDGEFNVENFRISKTGKVRS